MRHLGAVADVRLLHFHKGAGLGLLAKIVARTQVRPRTDVGRATDVGFLHAGTLHMGVGIDDRADKCCVWADLRALADHGLASRKHPGRITASRSIRTSSSIHVVSESRMVTPLRIQCSQIRLL